MKTKLCGLRASVILTAEEAVIVRDGSVPMIYGPGGMGPDMPPPEGGEVSFGGACYVEAEAKLRASLAVFRTALEDEIARRAAWQAGFDAFPSGRWMDAVRGTKSFPQHLRCPFTRPERVESWERGYEAALGLCTEASHDGP